VERMPVGRFVEAAPAIRQESDTTVYPVVVEVLVVEKRLRLVEEVRVTRRQATRHAREEIALRREEIAVEHVADSGSAGRDDAA
jgi:stress response protein YsnF